MTPNQAWEKLTRYTFNYIPLFIFLSVPFLGNTSRYMSLQVFTLPCPKVHSWIRRWNIVLHSPTNYHKFFYSFTDSFAETFGGEWIRCDYYCYRNRGYRWFSIWFNPHSIIRFRRFLQDGFGDFFKRRFASTCLKWSTNAFIRWQKWQK